MPSVDEELMQGVIDTIDATSQHRMQLTELHGMLEEASKQIVNSANTSRSQLKSHFESLKKCICSALDSRLRELECQVTTTEENALVPLTQCRDIIQQGLNTASSVMREGKRLLIDNTNDNRIAMLEFKKQTDRLGLDSLPDVPSLADVACISVELPEENDDQAETLLLEAIRDYGRVISRAPVQISELSERPGALLVSWTETDDEQDLCEYRLQRCYGNVRSGEESNHNFITVYQGAAGSCMVRHLKPLAPYTFRVCGKGEGAENWSPWSVPAVGMTTYPAYDWESAAGYEVTDSKFIERNASRGTRIAYSGGPCYTCGHSVVFRILESGESDPDDGIAICATKSEESLSSKNCIFVNTEGVVCQDGQEKTTRLPSLTKGASLTFETEVLQSRKVRVTIEVNEKIVTFDWTIESTLPAVPSLMGGFGILHNPASEPEIKLYFAARFKNQGWKIVVE